MALTVGELQLIIDINTKEIDQLKAKLMGIDQQAKKSQMGFAKLAGSFFTAQTAMNALNKGLQFGKQQFVNAIKNSRDLGEETNKFKVVFKGVGQEAFKMRDILVKSYGMSRLEATRTLAAFQDFLVPMGVAREKGLELSNAFTQMAVDIGSFNNAPTVEVLDAIKSGIAGMSRPMRRFGVDISETTLKQMALAQGIEVVGNKLDSQKRAELILQKIRQDSIDAADDFGRTSQDLANRQKILGAVFEDISSNLGQNLLPSLNNAAGSAIQLAKSFERMTRVKLSDELQKEQIELNALISSIVNVNVPTEERAKLIEKLNKEYPSFLDKLDKEKVSNEELKQRLAEVNDAYINRIIIQKEQENIEALTEKVANKKRKGMKAEIQLQKDIAELALKLGLSNEILGKTYSDQAKILEKALHTQKDLRISYKDGDGALTNINETIQYYNLNQKRTIQTEERLTDAQKLKKQIIDGLKISENELIKITTKSEKQKDKKQKQIKEEIDSSKKLKEQLEDELKLLDHKIKIEDKSVDTTGEQIVAYENLYMRMKQAGMAGEELFGIEQRLHDLRKSATPSGEEPEDETKKATLEFDASAFTQSMNTISNVIGSVQNTFTVGFQDAFNVILDESASFAQKFAAVFQAVGETIQSVLEGIGEIMDEHFEGRLEKLEEQHELEIEAIDEKLAREIELIENNGMTKQQALENEIINLQNAIATETDMKKRGDLEQQLSSKQKELKILNAQEDANKKKKESDKKYAKEKYKIEVEQFNTKKAMDIIQATISYALGLVSLWANVWSLGPIAGAIMGGIMTGLLTGIFASQVAMIASQQPPPPPKFARGGIAPGGTILAGEEGAELMSPPRGTQIFDAKTTEEVLNPNFTIRNELYISEEQMSLATSNSNKDNLRYESARR